MSDNIFSGVNQSVFDDRSVLSEDYTPERILERDDEIKQYRDALAQAIFGDAPSNVMVYGNTGVGKTAVTDFVLDQLIEAAAEHDIQIDVLNVNCNESSAYNVSRKLINQIRGHNEKQFPKTGLSTQLAYETLYEELHSLDGDVVFLVLDEIDHMSKADSFLYDLPRQASDTSDENLPLTLIGIANNFAFRQTLSAKTKSTLRERELKFPPYNANELNSILSDRRDKAFVDGAVEEGVIEYTSALAARDSGNARQALDLLDVGGGLTLSDGRDTVTVDDIDAAKKQIERGELESSLTTITEHQQIVLITLARLEESDKTPVRVKRLYDSYERVCEEMRKDPLTTTRAIRDHLGELAMQGFVDHYERNNGRRGGRYNEYELAIRPKFVFEILD
ncbi:Cdc6/Cdc18 family protein [Haloferax sulfurifontis]|uniref:ORC1-type DNA replication protein n=2 Tax=Haloferax sulfurifontis TaxID=255616 RepID=M0IKL2_9EURY|nr:orc1/cdc6 family replication initiation protein [Haloferax sulfurifontis]ELZ96557.1 ORC complex protein Cdc6/Orc1 [Haloferax sulfurifontis ATCC BAA-897]GGC72147.1 cell division control protein Cdc6 [Haloferax sulfurifontis]